MQLINYYSAILSAQVTLFYLFDLILGRGCHCHTSTRYYYCSCYFQRCRQIIDVFISILFGFILLWFLPTIFVYLVKSMRLLACLYFNYLKCIDLIGLIDFCGFSIPFIHIFIFHVRLNRFLCVSFLVREFGKMWFYGNTFCISVIIDSVFWLCVSFPICISTTDKLAKNAF